MSVRKFIFWLHLVAGVVAGTIILVMSATGVLLTYERQMLKWNDRRHFSSEPQGGPALPVEELLRRASAEGTRWSGVTLHSDPKEAAELSQGREKTVYVDASSGKVLGQGDAGWRQAFQKITAWHRWLGAEGPGRTTARAITGACNLAFAFLCISGVVIWWPRKMTWQHFRAVLLLKPKATGYARDWNWHHAIGVWSAIPLIWIVLTGVVMSYPWANRLLFSISGSPLPQGGPPGGGPEGGRGPGRNGGGARGEEGPGRRAERGGEERSRPERGGAQRAGGSETMTAQTTRPEGRHGERSQARGPGGSRNRDEASSEAEPHRPHGANDMAGGQRRERDRASSMAEAPPAGSTPAVPATAKPLVLTPALTQLAQQFPNWKTMAIRLPAGRQGGASVTVDQSDAQRPDLRAQAEIDVSSGAVRKIERYQDQNKGRQWRQWVRWTHTGEAGGWIGQTVAGLVSLGGVILVWTGIALSLRRLSRWRRKKAGQTRSTDLVEAETAF